MRQESRINSQNGHGILENSYSNKVERSPSQFFFLSFHAKKPIRLLSRALTCCPYPAEIFVSCSLNQASFSVLSGLFKCGNSTGICCLRGIRPFKQPTPLPFFLRLVDPEEKHALGNLSHAKNQGKKTLAGKL